MPTTLIALSGSCYMVTNAQWAGHTYTEIHASAVCCSPRDVSAVSEASNPEDYDKYLDSWRMELEQLQQQLAKKGVHCNELVGRGLDFALLFYDPEEVEYNLQLDGPARLEGKARNKLTAKCRRLKENLALEALRAAIQIKNYWVIRPEHLQRYRARLRPWPLCIGLASGRVFLRVRQDSPARVEGLLINQATDLARLGKVCMGSRVMLCERSVDLLYRHTVKHTQLSQRIFANAIAIEPEIGLTFNSDICYELDFCHRISVHLTDEQASGFKALITIDSSNLWAYHQLSDYYAFVKRDWQALAKLAKASNLRHPDNAKILLDLARYYRKSAQPETAASCAYDAIAANPRLDLAYELLAELAFEAEDFELVVSHFQNAQRITPDSPINNINLGLALLQNDRAEEGYNYIQAAIKSYPELATSQEFRESLLAIKHAGILPELYEYYLESNPEL